MATVYVTLQSAGSASRRGEVIPVAAKPFRSETITSSGTSAAGALVAQRGDVATVHGFRGSFKNWASEATGYPDAASEAALSHGDPDKVRGAYRTTDFLKIRTEMMEAWGAYCIDTGADGTGSNIVPISKAKAG